MKVGIVGHGVVGKAVAEGLESKSHKIMIYDKDIKNSKEYGYTNYPLEDIVRMCDIVFICVPTPTNEHGCDLSTVYDVFNKIHFHIAQIAREVEGIELPIIAIKSTCMPGTVDTLAKMYPRVCSNPEFLREKTALHDFLEPDRIIIGSDSEEVRETMAGLYADFDAPIICTSPKVAELAKYMSNAFLMVKVAYSQEMAMVSAMLGVSAVEVAQLVTLDHRIDESHLNPELGKMQAKSPCLPKDVSALITQLDKSGYDSVLLKSAYVGAVDGARLVPSFKIKEAKQ